MNKTRLEGGTYTGCGTCNGSGKLKCSLCGTGCYQMACQGKRGVNPIHFHECGNCKGRGLIRVPEGMKAESIPEAVAQ